MAAHLLVLLWGLEGIMGRRMREEEKEGLLLLLALHMPLDNPQSLGIQHVG